MLIGTLMEESGVTFGTSGARGLVRAMTDRVCYAYTLGFLQHLAGMGMLRPGSAVAIAGDRRASTPGITEACARAVVEFGCEPHNCGALPTPAVAAYGIGRSIPSLMVTGSHIPDDRNGIKFNTATGEILKADEEGIRRQRVTIPEGLFDETGRFLAGVADALPFVDRSVLTSYVGRYLGFFPEDALAGLRVGLYEHSTVAREPLYRVLTGLGAEVVRFGRSDGFIPVDTEAIPAEDAELARVWAAEERLDAIVSADGDGDRPLVSDEHGEWLRGDIAGVLCARFLGAVGVVTPVSSNTVLERSGWFGRVPRTRIGSPFVIAGMERLLGEGVAPVVGYEANGGFLLGSDLERDGRQLSALPSRDALLPIVAILAMAREGAVPVSALTAGLPRRFTHSDRLQEFPVEVSRRHLGELSTGDFERDRKAIDALFAVPFGPVSALDTTDGLRMTFSNGEIAHLRPSGNAPELRAYTEADSADRAREMNHVCMAILSGWKTG